MAAGADQDVMSAPPAEATHGSAEPDKAATESAAARKERTRPPRRPGPGTAWLAALACMAVAALPLLLELDRPPVAQPREARTLAESAETWRRLAEVGLDEAMLSAITPRYNGEDQLVGPPGTTWLHLLAFKIAGVSADPAAALDTLEDMVTAGRVTSVVAMLIMIGAVFWCGHAMGGIQPGFYAAAVAVATPTLLAAGRSATPDGPRVALIMLAMAAALWAIRPLKPAAPVWRQALGWLICGLALGVATLTTGPLAIAWVGYPVLLILLLCPHRLSHALGLVAAGIIALLFVAPWALHVHEQYPQIWGVWSQRLVPGAGDEQQSWWSLTSGALAVLLAAAMPWSLWIVAALVQPFSTSSAGSRGRMFLGWGWFLVVLLLVMLTPDDDALPAVLPVLPVIAVLMGQLFRQYADLSAEGRHARFWRALRWPQLGLFFALSVAGPVALAFQDDLVARGFLPMPMVRAMHPMVWVGAGTLLLIIVFFSLRFAVRQYPGWALVSWSIWMVVGVALLIWPVTHGELLQRPTVGEAKRVAHIAASESLYALNGPPPALVLLHVGHPVPVVDPQQVAAMRESGQGVTLLAPLDEPGVAGLAPVDDLPALGVMLWRSPAAPPTDADTMPTNP